jgi:hypothetical protein
MRLEKSDDRSEEFLVVISQQHSACDVHR